VGGFLDGIESGAFPEDAERLEIVELNPLRATRLTKILSDLLVSPSRPGNRKSLLQDAQTFSLDTVSHKIFVI
jgi:hypothetical protein